MLHQDRQLLSHRKGAQHSARQRQGLQAANPTFLSTELPCHSCPGIVA